MKEKKHPETNDQDQNESIQETVDNPTPVIQLKDKIILEKFVVAGYMYYNGELVEDALVRGTNLILVREPLNPHDNNAIALYFDDIKIGFIPRKQNSTIANMMDGGVPVMAQIISVQDFQTDFHQVRAFAYMKKDYC